MSAVLYTALTVVTLGVPAQATRSDSTKARVAQVELQRSAVFDSTETATWYGRLMNRVHVVTRPWVISRELLVQEGEAYDSTRAAETERNLRRLTLFSKVRIDTVTSASAEGPTMRVATQDAWSLKMSAGFSSSGDQFTLKASIKENNLLGLGLGAGVSYEDNPDRWSLTYRLKAPRVIANRVDVAALLSDLSDGKNSQIQIQMPFRAIASRAAFSADGTVFDGQVLRFVGGDPEPSEKLRRLYTLARAWYGWRVGGSTNSYRRVAVFAQGRREDYTDIDTGVTPGRTVTAALGSYFEASRVGFQNTRFYRSLGAQEDVDISETVRVGLTIAPQQWGYTSGGVGAYLRANAGIEIPRGFVLLRAEASTLFAGAGLDSGTFSGTATVVLQPVERQSLTVYAGATRDVEPYPGEEADLGLTSGPRAFPIHAFTGDRAFFTSAEYRWTPWANVLQLFGLGFGAFIDYGGAWFGDESPRTGADAGIGLRFASTRTGSQNGATRIDLARRFAGDSGPARWVIAIGTGFLFESLW